MSKKLFIPYIMAGDPSLRATEKYIYQLEKAGCDIIELGIPFSDPIADGLTIQAAGQRALKKKTSLLSILKLVKKVRRTSDIPIILMSYYNVIFHLGLKNFTKRAKEAGVNGIIIPDLPFDESAEIERALKGSGIQLIYLLAPTSTNDRIKAVGKKTKSFIYYVSVTGITGVRKKLPKELKADVKKIKRLTGKKVAVGFGVSSPGMARDVARSADGVIVGSAIVKLIEEKKRIDKFTTQLARAVHSV